jgi:hypothetical protein
MSVQSAKAAGSRIEADVIDRFDALRYVPESEATWHEAETVALLPPESSNRLRFGGIVVVELGTSTEVKGSQVETSNGNGSTAGRWYVKKSTHQSLLNANGVYLLVVYTPNWHDHLARIVVPASILDEHLRGRWYEVAGDRSEEVVAQLAWPHVLDREVVVDGGEGHV